MSLVIKLLLSQDVLCHIHGIHREIETPPMHRTHFPAERRLCQKPVSGCQGHPGQGGSYTLTWSSVGWWSHQNRMDHYAPKENRTYLKLCHVLSSLYDAMCYVTFTCCATCRSNTFNVLWCLMFWTFDILRQPTLYDATLIDATFCDK